MIPGHLDPYAVEAAIVAITEISQVKGVAKVQWAEDEKKIKAFESPVAHALLSYARFNKFSAAVCHPGGVKPSGLKIEGGASKLATACKPSEITRGWHRAIDVMNSSITHTPPKRRMVSPFPTEADLASAALIKRGVGSHLETERVRRYCVNLSECGLLFQVNGVPIWAVASKTEGCDLAVAYHDRPNGAVLPQCVDEMFAMLMP